MLLSMTGYGQADRKFDHRTIHIDIRSVNSKFLDLKVKLPATLRDKESQIRQKVMEVLDRGKIDLNIEFKSDTPEQLLTLNKPLFIQYYQELSTLARQLELPTDNLLSSILTLPNVLTGEENAWEEKAWEVLLNGLDEALDNFNSFRAAEGTAMKEDLNLRIKLIRQYLEQVDPHESNRIDKVRTRLHAALEEFWNRDTVDEHRFEQEILFYLERMDITEEKVRLGQHLVYFSEELNSSEPNKGRKLAFISQEMGREINTMGAKAYSSEIQKLVVCMKDELEKIKEQLSNAV